MEGAHGYLGFAAGMIGGVVGMVLGILIALRWQGVTGAGSLAAGSLKVGLTIAALAALAFGIYWLSIPKRLNRNGASPIMHFEVIPSAGFPADPSTVRASLNSNSEGRPEVHIAREWGKSEDGQSLFSGRVELYYRASWRLLVLDLPDKRALLFRLRLPADPTTAAKHRKWSDWYLADQVDPAGEGTPVNVKSEADSFKIRYRIDFWMEPSR